MLEAIRERSQGWFAKIILAMILVPFALWGVDSYFKNTGDGDYVAKVDGYKISPQEFAQNLQQQQDRLREMMKGAYDPSMMDKPEVRLSVLDNLINQRLLINAAVKTGMLVPDAEIAAVIGGVEAFQQDGKFSQERYETLLKRQGMTPIMFEMRVRQDLMTQQLRHPYAETSFMSRAVAERVVKLLEQQREVSQVRFMPDSYVAQIKLDPAAIKTYYDAHRSDFAVPQQVRLEYVVLSVDNLATQMSVDDEEIKRYFEENAARYQQPESRRASHILINLAGNASAAEKEAAAKKAEQIYQEAKQNPGKFAELAKKYSQDTGSAAQGGDLGSFGRGQMVKAFEDAVFQMKVDELRGPVQSEFGYHIIKLTGITAAKGKGLEDVKAEVAQEVKKQKAGKKFAEVAESFSNRVYEQADSLKPSADEAKLTVLTSGWVAPADKGGASSDPLLNHPKLLQAVFSDESLKNRRNTEAVEVSPNTLVAARVIEHKPESVKPIEAVTPLIESKLKHEQAIQLAIQEGKAKLAQVKQGNQEGVNWSAPQMVSRQNPQAVNPADLPEVFKVDAVQLPVYVGVESKQGGYALYRISKALEASQPDAAKTNAMAGNLRQLVAEETYNAYLASLKSRSEVKVNKANVEKTER